MMKNSRNVEDAMNEAIQHEHIETLQNEHMSEISNANDGPLPSGTTILDGQYRLLELLHQRPRVNLYLGRRLPRTEMTKQQLEAQESLVVIRELVLLGLPRQFQKQVEQAAFEEFVSPAMFGSLRLPGAGDRVRIEGERHYLVMQLRGAHSGKNGNSREKEWQTVAVTLTELLLNRRQWPLWLDMETALNWGIQLCRIVARLHRLGLVPGDLDPNTVLVDEHGPAEWPPVLLVSWPPAPQFWCESSTQSDVITPWLQIFPLATTLATSAFAAPETLEGRCDERSDVYSLGAILYLLLTRYAPIAARQRRHTAGIELIPPRLFNAQIPVPLEQVMLCALSLAPEQRYPTVFALIEALERIDMKLVDADSTGEVESPFKKVVRWVKHE
ncbi:MAG: serine/threonine protein kinase [Ktedonobacteraceae bacterium]